MFVYPCLDVLQTTQKYDVNRTKESATRNVCGTPGFQQLAHDIGILGMSIFRARTKSGDLVGKQLRHRWFRARGRLV